MVHLSHGYRLFFVNERNSRSFSMRCTHAQFSLVTSLPLRFSLGRTYLRYTGNFFQINAVTCTVTVPYCIIIEYPLLDDSVTNFRALHLQDGAN